MTQTKTDNNIADVLHSEFGVDLPTAIAVAYVLTNDESLVSDLDDTNYQQIADECSELSIKFGDTHQNMG